MSGSLPLDKIGIVMRAVENETNYYDVWYDELGKNMVRLQSRLKLEPGQWVETVGGKLQLAAAPITVDRIKRPGENNLFKLVTKILKAEDEYFLSENVSPGVQKYKKYVGLSTDFGIIFLHKKISERMKPGILYNVEICNFALLQHHEERDLKILKVMKALGTLWLASNFEKEQLLDVAEFGNGEWDVAAEDMMTAHAYVLRRHAQKAIEPQKPMARQETQQDSKHNAERSVLSQTGSDKMKSSSNMQKAPEKELVVSESEFIQSLTRIITNDMVRSALLRVDGAEQLKIMDEFLRNPQKLM